MLDTILNILKPETFVLVLLGLIPLLLLAAKYPEVVWAFGFPILLFIGELKDLIPISTSALSGIFSLIAIAGGMFKGYRFRFGRIEKAFVLLVGLMYFSLSYSHSTVYGAEKVMLVLGMSLPLVLAASYTLVSFETLKRALNIISLSLVIYIIVSASMKLFGAVLPVENRFGGIQGPTMSGRCLGLFVIVYFYWWFSRETAWKVWGYFVMAGAVLLVFLTGTRTAVAALFGTVLAVYYLREKAFFISLLKKAWRPYFLLIVFFVFTMFGPSLLSIVLPQSLYEGRFSSLDRFTHLGDFEQPSSRVLNTVVAWEAFLESPFLGLGAGGYKSALWNFGCRSIFLFDPRSPSYPHNIFLEFLTEQGMPGLILFCYMMYHAFRILFDVRACLPWLSGPQKQMAITVSAFFIYGFLVAQTAVDIPRQHILWWGLGLLISLPRTWQTRVCTVRKTAMQSGRNVKAADKPIPNPMAPQPNPSKLRRQLRNVFPRRV